MDNSKIGKLIYQLRKEKGMTQTELAGCMNISDKTVSKWERGLGCPDVSLLSELSDIFNVDLSEMLSGQLTKNNILGGRMKRIKIYACPECGNIIIVLTDTSISCCGKKLRPLELTKAEGRNKLDVERIENEYYISADHEMSKEHFISFVAFISDDTVIMRKQYPEWNLQVRIPFFAHGRLVWYCTRHGLFYQDI
ncbi:MAG: helix-turn-helix domain-containing protein [Oscillospiraceae bacterium]|nr:helix-turn-helix domain-containing protein [Oscillospiraceae bacterium]